MVCKDWYDIYAARMNESYRRHVRAKYGRFIDEIISCCGAGDEILEDACGAANISYGVWYKEICFNITAQDIDPKMLELSKITMAEAKNVTFKISDMFEPTRDKKYNLIYSHGALEHHSDAEIRRLIAIQRQYSYRLLHYVPSSMYENPSRGDERLLSVEEWHRICCPDEIISFNGGYDLILKWVS